MGRDPFGNPDVLKAAALSTYLEADRMLMRARKDLTVDRVYWQNVKASAYSLIFFG